MGTTSIHGFFGCSGYTTTHLRCTHANYCAKCMKESVDEGLPPLFKCTKELGFMSDAFSQIDGNTNEGNFFTQIDLLEDFVRGYPNATFILTFRSMEKWFHSLSNWGGATPKGHKPISLKLRLQQGNYPGFPTGKGKNVEEFSEWWCWHVNRVRSTIKRYNGTLVEVDIEDSNAGQHMGEMFGINPSCWGRANVNTQIHQDLNQTVIGRLPWLMTDGFGPTGQRIFNVSNNRQVVQL